MPDLHRDYRSLTERILHDVLKTSEPIVFVVDDDSHTREEMRELLEQGGRKVIGFATCEAFLADYDPGHEACLVIDAYLPGMTGPGHRLIKSQPDSY